MRGGKDGIVVYQLTPALLVYIVLAAIARRGRYHAYGCRPWQWEHSESESPPVQFKENFLEAGFLENI